MSSNDFRRSYEPPAYTPVPSDNPEQPPVPPPPQQQDYPRYSQGYPPQQQPQGYPQQGGYPHGQGYPQYTSYSQDQQYGYGAQPAAVVVGVTGEHEPHVHVNEQFSEQLNRLPRRMLLAISKPYVANYNELKTYATMEMTFLILMIVIVWAIIIDLIAYAIAGATGIGYAILGAIFGTLIFFFLSNLLFHGVAMCLGGGANQRNKKQLFIQLCWCTLVFSLPLDLLGILTWIPIFGFIVAFALFIYKLVLTVITLRSVYGVDTCHAIGILICYIIIVIIVVVCFWTLVGGAWALLLLRVA
jgi:hypothetical protein